MGLGGYALTSFIPVAMAMIAYGFSFMLSQRSLERAGQAKRSGAAQASGAQPHTEDTAEAKSKEKKMHAASTLQNDTESAKGASKNNAEKIAIALGFAALGVVLGALFPPASPLAIGTGVAAGLLALLIAALVVKHKATITTGFILSALAALLMIAAEAVAAHVQGQTLMGTLAATTSDTVQSLEASLPLSVQAELASFVPLVQMLWPFVLFCAAGIAIACAHASARLAQLNAEAAQRQQITMWRLSAFDAPVWAPIVLATGIVCFAFSPVFVGISPDAAFWIQSAGLSIMMAIRIIFFLDGAATVSWFLEKKKWGCLVRILIWIVALYLEGFCFLLSIIGFLDFWANFRKRNRTRKHTIR